MAFSAATYAKGNFGKVYKVTFGNTHAALKKVPSSLNKKLRKRKIYTAEYLYICLKHNNNSKKKIFAYY